MAPGTSTESERRRHLPHQDMPQDTDLTFKPTPQPFEIPWRNSARKVFVLWEPCWLSCGQQLYTCRRQCTRVSAGSYRVSRDFHIAFLTVAILLVFWTDCSLTVGCGILQFRLLERTRALHLAPQGRHSQIVGVENADKPDLVFGGSLRQRHQ